MFGGPYSGVVGPNSLSTPFNPDGSVRQQWADNLGFFFYDLHSNGIQRVTPTPVFDSWSGPSSLMVQRQVLTCTNPDGTGGQLKTLNFFPWLPYALDPSNNNFPESTCMNNSYASAARTPDDVFWNGHGWNMFFTLMGAILGKAAQNGTNITVDSLDYYQESNLAFTVEARMLYDNQRNVDVLQSLRNAMSANGFDPNRVAPSANGPGTPNPANSDCGSFYGDSAMLLTLSELSAGISGPYGLIGMPPFSVVNNLPCYSSGPNTMVSVPVYHSQPTFFDMHSQKVYASDVDTKAWATNYYSDIWAFMQNRGFTEDRVVFGETNPVDLPGCSEWTQAQATAMVSGYKASMLFQNRASSVVMRPWHRTELINEPCTPSPNIINPPFDSRNP